MLRAGTGAGARVGPACPNWAFVRKVELVMFVMAPLHTSDPIGKNEGTESAGFGNLFLRRKILLQGRQKSLLH